MRRSKVAAVAAGPVDRAEQLVQEVAVAVLDVDEVEPGLGGEHGGVDVALDQRVELVVGQHGARRRRRRARRARDGGRRCAARGAPVGRATTGRSG